MELDYSTPEKEFCCLKMKEVIQAQIYEETKDMTTKEYLAYIKKGAKESPLWQRLKATKL
jgi:hypothetical protein